MRRQKRGIAKTIDLRKVVILQRNNYRQSIRCGRMLLNEGTGNGEPGTENRSLGVYSGNPHEKSKWLTKPSQESEFNYDIKAKFFRLSFQYCL